MQNQLHFDYVIIGNGLAGLQLALGFSKDSFFDSKSIALIDLAPKVSNDKTWSFWEQHENKWAPIIHKSWKTALFESNDVSMSLPLGEYTYKSIRSLDFYNYSKELLDLKSNIHFVLDEIKAVEQLDIVTVKGQKNNYTAQHVFDSRIPSDFFSKSSNYNVLQQHFKGWVIETNHPCLKPEAFTMMDYRFHHKNSTSFIYVLPFSETKALIEFTFFTPYTVDESVYDDALKAYITNHLKIDDYKILETEIGNIPMTDFPFWNYNTTKITKIGTGGGWVKGSTGYSFKLTEKYVDKVILNIKNGLNPSSKLIQKKFKFYDTIFLDVLKHHNEKGIWIFEQFYSKNSVATMFRFLDEETSFREDLLIMKSLFSMTFIKAFFRVLLRF